MAYPGESVRSTMGLGDADATGVGDRLKDAATTAANTIEDGRAAATDTLKSAAGYIGDKVSNMPGSETVQRTAAAAADSVAATADYIRNTDAERMAADVEALVKRNPGPALLAAGVLGFLIGRSLSR